VPSQVFNTSSSSWASAAFHWLLDLAGVKPAHLVAFFTSEHKWSLSWILTSLTQCDLASTLTCSRHDKDLIMSTVVFALLYLVARPVTQAVGMGFLATLLLFSYPWFILWYTYGMPPSCAPLIPTCLLADIIAAVESIVPAQILFPKRLLCDGANQTCLRSCTELAFESWADPVAFAICDTDDGLCTALQDLGPSGIGPLDELLWGPAREAMARFQPVVRAGDVAGHRLCTWVTFVTAVPVIALLVTAALVLTAAVTVVLELVPVMLALLCQAGAFYET
jgi:hypothetical protein